MEGESAGEVLEGVEEGTQTAERGATGSNAISSTEEQGWRNGAWDGGINHLRWTGKHGRLEKGML